METGIRVFFGIPAYGGLLMGGFVRSYMEIQRKGILHKVCHVDGDSLVSRARNTLTAEFLKSDCTHLLFIDTDIVFEPWHVERLIKHAASGLPIVAGLYPKKQPDLAWVINTMENEQTRPDGLRRVKYAGTGFMLIARSAFERIQNAYPELAFWTDSGELHDGKREVRHDYWRVGVHRPKDVKATEPGRYLSEDWFFCQMLDDLGIPIMVDMTVHVKHIGQIAYPTADIPMMGPDGKIVEKPKPKVTEKSVDMTIPKPMERHIRKIFDGEYIFENPVKDGDIIVDIGANVGGFAAWARACWPHSPIICYEPVPENFKLLKENLKHDGIATLVDAAVTDKHAGKPMYAGANNPGECSFLQTKQQDAGKPISVKTVPPAQVPRGHFYKIDAEGCEVEIVTGLDLTDAKSLILEWHSEADWIFLKNWFAEKGWVIASDAKKATNRGLLAVVKKEFAKDGRYDTD